jgi:DNA-binding NarL/FixJ family response regulator
MGTRLQIRYSVTPTDIWGAKAGHVLLVSLSEIELRLLRHAARGLSDKQIAAEVQRSPNTVKYHMHMVRKKLNVRTRFQLALTVKGLLTKDRSDG